MLSKGCFTGLEDRIYGNTHYSLNVECASNKGTIYIITGKKLDMLEKMSRIWSQVLEQMEKNCRVMTEKFACILRNRSKFTFGRRPENSHDPEVFMQFRRLQTREPNRKLEEKMEF